ncbi:MAG: alpha/beta hydrolase, partial [Jatrophihabitantaceae bacterium]
MGPTSLLVLEVVLLLAVALLVAISRVRIVAVKVIAGIVALALGMFGGILVVNDYYGYYTTWGAAVADLSGNSNAYAVNTATAQLNASGHRLGRVLAVRMPGRRSGISREGLVYLPPQYDEPAYRKVRFPVIELFHGTPGSPAQVVNQMRIVQIAAHLIDARRMGPVVLVMPDSNGGHNGVEECLNTSSFRDDTYMSQDIPADIRARFRVSRDTHQWGLMGASSGGYCAANLMMRHRNTFGAAASIDGYFRPADGEAGAVLGSDPAALNPNDPLAAALALRPGSGRLPPFWVAAGTGVSSDYVAAKAMVDAMRRLEQVPFLVLGGARHTMFAVRAALPSAFVWSWQQLCTPAQRSQFPTIATKLGTTIKTSPPH